MAAAGSTGVVMVALAANLGIAVAKFAAAAWTASSAMLSEAIHSLVDTSNQALLLFGIKRAARPADARHPFGYSRELYFWSFIVAILLFSMGAGVAIYEGVHKLTDPHPVSNPEINYIVLSVAMLLEGFSTWKAVSVFNAQRGEQGLVAALKSSKDPALFTVVLEDLAAMTGLVVALVGVFVADRYGIAEADGIASIVIGLVLGFVAAFMSIEIQALIIGESADAKVQAGLALMIAEEAGGNGSGRPIRHVNEIRTVHLGPDDVLVAASVDFHDAETAKSVEATIGRLDRRIRSVYPQVRRLYLEVQSEADHRGVLRPATGSVPVVATGAPGGAVVVPSDVSFGSGGVGSVATSTGAGVGAGAGAGELVAAVPQADVTDVGRPGSAGAGAPAASVSPRINARPPNAKKRGKRRRK